MTIRLSQEIETRLRDEASRRGIDAETYAAKLIVAQLAPAASAGSLAELFAQWQMMDGTADPAELERRQREFEEFKQTINQNRIDTDGASTRRVYP